MTSSNVSNSRAHKTGGVLCIDDSASAAAFVNAVITGSQAYYGGVLALSRGGNVKVIGCTVADSEAEEGGVIVLWMPTCSAEFSDSRILDSLAHIRGGVMYVAAGHLQLFKTAMIRSQQAGMGDPIWDENAGNVIGGGAAFVRATGLVHAYEITISNSSALSGGAIKLYSGGSFFVMGSAITSSCARYGGGTAYVQDGGQLVFAPWVNNGSVIHNSSASEGGSVLRMAGGVAAFLWGTRVSQSSGSPALHVGAGRLMVYGATIEDSTSPDFKGIILLIPKGASKPFITFTHTGFRQHVCNGTLFEQGDQMQLLLRNITLTPLPGCDPAALASAGAFGGVDPLGCGGELEDRQGNTWTPCSSSAPGACTSHPVNGTVLSSVQCQCPWPEVPNPRQDSGAYHLNEQGDVEAGLTGCVDAMRKRELAYVSKRVLITLRKPASASANLDDMEQTVNVSMVMLGTDVTNPANWSVLNATLVMERSPWLHLPVTCAETDARAIAEATRSRGENNLVQIPLVLTSYNLSEQAEPYEDTLSIRVHTAT